MSDLGPSSLATDWYLQVYRGVSITLSSMIFFLQYEKKRVQNYRQVVWSCGRPAGASYLVSLLVLFMAAKCVCQVRVSLATPLWPPPAIKLAQVTNTG